MGFRAIPPPPPPQSNFLPALTYRGGGFRRGTISFSRLGPKLLLRNLGYFLLLVHPLWGR